MPDHSPIGSCCARPRFGLAAGLDDRRRAARQAPSAAVATVAALQRAVRRIVGIGLVGGYAALAATCRGFLTDALRGALRSASTAKAAQDARAMEDTMSAPHSAARVAGVSLRRMLLAEQSHSARKNRPF